MASATVFHSHPEILSGAPVFVGTRVPVRALLDYIEEGSSIDEFLLDLDWVGPGYGVPSEAGMEAIQRLAKSEGIFLDPIYSAKAFAALMGLAVLGAISGRVLFWHTGGLPALFAMQDVDR